MTPKTKTKPRLPREKPCGSCPYRKDVPSGVWSEQEYRKLAAYAEEDQPIMAFCCHTDVNSICAGWAACPPGPQHLLALRIGAALGHVDPATFDYTTDVPLHPSHEAAASFGLRDIDEPSDEARAFVAKLERLPRLKGDKS